MSEGIFLRENLFLSPLDKLIIFVSNLGEIVHLLVKFKLKS